MRVLSLNLFIFISVLLAHARASRVSRDLKIRSRLRKREQHEEGRCPLLSEECHPSRLEQKWLDNAHRWSDDFCSRMDAFSEETYDWLNTIAALERSEVSATTDGTILQNFPRIERKGYACTLEGVASLIFTIKRRRGTPSKTLKVAATGCTFESRVAKVRHPPM